MKLVTTPAKTLIVNNFETGRMARDVRMLANISLREMARRLGYSAPFVSDLEKGRRSWTQAKVDAWKKALKR